MFPGWTFDQFFAFCVVFAIFVRAVLQQRENINQIGCYLKSLRKQVHKSILWEYEIAS